MNIIVIERAKSPPIAHKAQINLIPGTGVLSVKLSGGVQPASQN